MVHIIRYIDDGATNKQICDGDVDIDFVVLMLLRYFDMGALVGIIPSWKITIEPCTAKDLRREL